MNGAIEIPRRLLSKWHGVVTLQRAARGRELSPQGWENMERALRELDEELVALLQLPDDPVPTCEGCGLQHGADTSCEAEREAQRDEDARASEGVSP